MTATRINGHSYPLSRSRCEVSAIHHHNTPEELRLPLLARLQLRPFLVQRPIGNRRIAIPSNFVRGAGRIPKYRRRSLWPARRRHPSSGDEAAFLQVWEEDGASGQIPRSFSSNTANRCFGDHGAVRHRAAHHVAWTGGILRVSLLAACGLAMVLQAGDDDLAVALGGKQGGCRITEPRRGAGDKCDRTLHGHLRDKC